MSTASAEKASKISTVIRKLMSEVNITEAELARRTDIPQPTLHRILSGSTRSPRSDSLSPLANFFSVTISQLIGDDPLPSDRIPGAYNPNIAGWTALPIIDWEQAPQWSKLQNDLRDKQWSSWVSTDAKVSAESFAILASGEALSNRFVDGTTLIIDPSLSPEDGDYVVVQLKNQKVATFKQMIFDGESAYLKSLNPEFPTQPWGKGDKVLGVMVQARMDFRKPD